MSVKNVNVVLSAAVATSGTFTVTYPTGTDAGWFKGGTKHKIVALGQEFSSPVDFAITTFAATTCTVTWRNAATLPANSTVRVGLDVPGINYREPTNVSCPPSLVTMLHPRRIHLGAPVTIDTAGVAAVGSAPAGGLGSVTINGTRASGGVYTADVPRNIVITKTDKGTQVGATITVNGFDIFGKSLIEAITGQGTGTDASGLKAFYKVSSIVITGTSLGSATLSFAVGFGDTLGLPVFVPSSGHLLKELEDQSTASAGTFIGGLALSTASTATTADVRGTYKPNSASNSSKVFELLVLLSDPDYKGNVQFGSLT